MINKVANINIAAESFPDEFVSDKKKATKEFGLSVARAIQYQWFRRDGGRSLFYDRWNTFHNRRLYASAKQPVAKYKNELAVNGDMSHLNLDFTNIPIIPKFVDIVVNGQSDRLFKPKAIATDAMSMQKRNKFQDMVEGQMVARDFLELIQEKAGVNAFTMDPGDLPQSDDELAIYMNMNYKPAAEIAEEEAISEVFADNDFAQTRYQYDRDKTVLGVGFMKHDFLEGQGIVISYVDPANMVWSYTEDIYFRDCFYFGEVKTIPVNELLKIDNKLQPSELELIGKTSSAWYDYYGRNFGKMYGDEIYNNNTATVLYFDYKTTKKVTYKKKYNENGGFRMVEKEDDFEPSDDDMKKRRYEKVQKTIDIWYTGCYVLGTDIIVQWKAMDRMVRPKSAMQKAMPRYVGAAPHMYKGVIESLTERMIPFADQIQLIHLKMQQVAQRVVPDGIFIDADGLTEIDLGNGAAYSPQEALSLYFQTGSVIGRSFTQDGEFNHGKIPIQELATSSGNGKLQSLVGMYNHYLDMIRTVTGLNEARDGSDPDPRSLVGVQKLAALNSNVATRHLLDSSLYNVKQLAEAVSIRMSDILEFEDFEEQFAMKIGKYNMSIIEEFKDLYLYDFGIHIEVTPDEEERAKLEENINIALKSGNIDIEDAIDIREINNVKFANQLLKFKRIKKQERDAQAEMQKQQMQAQMQMQAQQMAAQAQQMKIQAEAQAKIAAINAEAQKEIAVLDREAALKRDLMYEEFMYNMQLKGVEAQQLKSREETREDRKDKRQTMNNTQQSKMIDQRKKDLPPINFESTVDTLDGLGLEEYGPK